jgi:hypothetical protein
MSTLDDIGNLTGNSTATTRWATFGPYYAMFPIEFAFQVIDQFSKKGDYVIDPFAGRYSAIYASAMLERNSTGIEINPVGWIYGKTKLSPASKDDVLNRLKEICTQSYDLDSGEVIHNPEFFTFCFSENVRKFLLTARENLNWKSNKIDRSLMAIILVNLHGKLGEGLSNQMRQTKAMSPTYSIQWWKKNGYNSPPVHDPLKFLTEKIEWRYRKGVPERQGVHRILLGDSTKRLNDVARESTLNGTKYSLLFTSPPYQGVVDYHSDQWLRLWLLNRPKPTEKYSRRFDSKTDYAVLLDRVFGKCAALMAPKNTVFIRTDVRSFTLETTLSNLRKHFPNHHLEQKESTVSGISQTELFNNVSKRKELDIVLRSK